ncbi:SMI1/KNR4 family protein [Nocardia sp. NPDC050697]|uniref:SMI1/KNR4 family protein n=1 Tax=Nocardia sp. NPDC050697 TaxID=3155158 RepID=UPI0033DD6B4F
MSETIDWRSYIGYLIMLKGKIDEIDPDFMDEYTIPRVAALESEISAIESAIDSEFPDQYREFLLHANGWPYFYWITDLFGTPELGGADGIGRVAELDLADLAAEGLLAELGLGSADVIPIAAGEGSEHIFLMVKRDISTMGGKVIWVSGGEVVDVLDDFESMFRVVVAEHEQMMNEAYEGANNRE